jgi:uncharacterized protein
MGSTKTTSLKTVADQFEEIQQRLKESVPQSPLAYSVNGKDFGYETSLSAPLTVGSYVTILREDGEEYLGQIITQDILVREGPEYGLGLDADLGMFVAKMTTSSQLKDRLRVRYIQGVGRLLGKLNREGFTPATDSDIFQEAGISSATDEAIAQYFSSITRGYSELEVGKVLHTDGQARVLLRASGFDRHSFLCGQSGSGKTFALGVILEQILLETDLRVVIIDPNSDFIKLDQLRSIEDINKTRSTSLSAEQYESIRKRYDEARPSLRIMRPKGYTKQASNHLRIRLSDLEPHEQEAILRLDPLNDREECHLFWNTIADLVQRGDYSLDDVYTRIRDQSVDSKVEKIKQRFDNLRIADWGIWCPVEGPSLVDELGGDWRCLVADIGMLSPPQNSIIAMAILGYFWSKREQKAPVLIVIDEAHHVCPQSPLSTFTSMSTEHAIHIAGEGRKFGIYLLLATQRPEKVHSNIVSQSDNLVLMRMNSSKDLNYIAETFSQVPVPLLNQSPGFSQGEALLTGKITSGVTFTKFEGRLAYEGGGDVPATWAVQDHLSESAS